MSSWLWNPSAKARIELIGFLCLGRRGGRPALSALRTPGCRGVCDERLSSLPSTKSTRQCRRRTQLTGINCSHQMLIGRLCVYRWEFPSVMFFSANKWRTSSMSLSTQQDMMISFVNTEHYESPPAQTRALFAKLLIPSFEEITACAAALRHFYRRL